MLRRHEDAAVRNASDAAAFFADSPVGTSIGRNRMTRVLAGEFCCAGGGAVQYDSVAAYERAVRRLQEFCVVGLTSRVQVGREKGM